MISSHVLDTALGRPAPGVPVRLDVLEPNGQWQTLARAVTNDDGRVTGLAASPEPGGHTYRLTFELRAYFEASARAAFFPWVEIVFSAEAADAHHHVPLLLSPFGYSTYRGS
jgi:5-hydroxyisourate hydrolase